jgi:ankyrin repeat protein
VFAGVSLLAASLPDAVQNDDQATVQALLRQKVDVNAAQGDGTTALHWAAFNDNLNLTKLLLAAGANVKATTRDGAITPLMMACRNGSAPMIDLLLKAGANPNSATVTGTTALMMAASSGSADAVRVLLDHGANVNATDVAHGQTALMFAASLNRADTIKVLMAHGANASLTSMVTKTQVVRFNPDGNIVLTDEPEKPGAAKEETKKEETKEAKEEKPAADGKQPEKKKGGRERGAQTMGGQTALIYAARDGQIDATRALLESGANVNQASAEEKTTPLVMAIMNGHLDVAKVLLDHGADPNLANVWGLTPLFAVVDVQWAPYAWFPQPLVTHEQVTYLDLMKDLLVKSANPNARLGKQLWVRSFGNRSWVDPVGSTAFWRAAQSNDVTGMKLLVASGADPKIATNAGDTALMVAAGLGWAPNNTTTIPDAWLPTVEYCLSLGLDVNAVDEKGYTALHGVAFRGDNDLIKYLVSKGAKVDLKTKEGDTIADMANGPIAHSIPHPDTVTLLESLGSANSHNCRSDQCVVATKEEKPKEEKPKEEKPKEDKKPVAVATSPH